MIYVNSEKNCSDCRTDFEIVTQEIKECIISPKGSRHIKNLVINTSRVQLVKS